jgi:hypothetical protein
MIFLVKLNLGMVVGDAMKPLLWDYRWHVQKIGAMILEGLVHFITNVLKFLVRLVNVFHWLAS